MSGGTYQHGAQERVVFGAPCASAVAEEAGRLGAERVFLMVSRSLNRETQVVAGVEQGLGGRYAGSFEGMPPHTPRDAVLAAAAQAREVRADLLVTIGGGSLTDGGKIAQIALRHDITEMDGLDDFRETLAADGSRHGPQFEGPLVRQITVPTTLSGGEFNPHAGCTDPRRKMKEGYKHPELVPRVVILDPAATIHTPEWLWLSTGVRAVDHAVETLCSERCNPYAEGTARQALRLLSQGLPRCREQPDDLEARLNCQLGVWLSMEFSRHGIPLGASHAIGHILGGTCGVAHGHTSCVMMPHVLRYNAPANAARQAAVSEAFGRPGRQAADVVGEFISGLGMPRSLAEVGVEPAQFELIAKNTMHDHWIYTNPRPIGGPEAVMEILTLAA